MVEYFSHPIILRCAANAVAPKMELENLRQIPILDIRGTLDKVIKVRDGMDTAERTGAETAFVADAGHLPFAEQPEEFMLIVTEFLNAVESGFKGDMIVAEQQQGVMVDL